MLLFGCLGMGFLNMCDNLFPLFTLSSLVPALHSFNHYCRRGLGPLSRHSLPYWVKPLAEWAEWCWGLKGQMPLLPSTVTLPDACLACRNTKLPRLFFQDDVHCLHLMPGVMVLLLTYSFKCSPSTWFDMCQENILFYFVTVLRLMCWLNNHLKFILIYLRFETSSVNRMKDDFPLPDWIKPNGTKMPRFD